MFSGIRCRPPPSCQLNLLACTFLLRSGPVRRYHPSTPSSRMVIFMKASAARVTTAVLAVVVPVHVLLLFLAGAGVLTLLVYGGLALPAVWSAKPARRRAAADVLRKILATFRHG